MHRQAVRPRTDAVQVAGSLRRLGQLFAAALMLSPAVACAAWLVSDLANLMNLSSAVAIGGAVYCARFALRNLEG